MQLGISSFTYGWNVGLPQNMPAKPFSELDLIDKAVQFNASVLQIGDNLPLHEFDKSRLGVFTETLKEKKVQLEVGAKGMNAENLYRYILLAAEAGSRLLRFVTDSAGYQPTVKEIIELVNKHVSLLKKYDITLALENHDRLKVRELAAIIETVNSPNVGICLDTVNSIGAGESIDIVIALLGPHTVNLHIKDFGIERLPHNMGFMVEGRIAGGGMLDIPSLLREIKGFDKCRTVILEQWVIPENKLEDTVIKEALWAKKSFQYLESVLAAESRR